MSFAETLLANRVVIRLLIFLKFLKMLKSAGIVKFSFYKDFLGNPIAIHLSFYSHVFANFLKVFKD